MIYGEYLILLVVLLGGVVLTAVTLPGTWLMCGAIIVYAAVTRASHLVGWKSIVALLVLAAVAEVIDTMASGAGAKKAGASRLAMFGAVVGGVLGAIFLSFILFFPLGTIAGACIGCFVGAGSVELVKRRGVGHSLNVGFQAAWGRLVGIVVKLLISLGMMVLAAVVALPIHVKNPPMQPALRGTGVPVPSAASSTNGSATVPTTMPE